MKCCRCAQFPPLTYHPHGVFFGSAAKIPLHHLQLYGRYGSGSPVRHCIIGRTKCFRIGALPHDFSTFCVQTGHGEVAVIWEKMGGMVNRRQWLMKDVTMIHGKDDDVHENVPEKYA